MYHLRPSQGVGAGLGSDVMVVSTGMLVGIGVSSGCVGLFVGEPLLHTSSYGQLTFTPNDSLQQVCMFSNTTSSLSNSPLLVHFSPSKYHWRPPSQASHGVGATVGSLEITSTAVGSADIISGVGVVGFAVGLGFAWIGLLVVGFADDGAGVVGSAVIISGIVGAAEVGSAVTGADVVGSAVMISGTVGASEVGYAEVGSEVIGADVVGADVIISGIVGASEVGDAEVGLAVEGLCVGELSMQTSSY